MPTITKRDEPWNQWLLRALEEDEEDASMVSVHSVDEDEERALLQDTVVVPPASTTQPQTGKPTKAKMSKTESVKDDGSTSYKNFDRLRYSIRSNKGHVTRWLDALKDVRTRLESGGGSQFDVDKARDILKKLSEKVDKVQSQLDELWATYPLVREDVETQKDSIFQEAQPDINRAENVREQIPRGRQNEGRDRGWSHHHRPKRSREIQSGRQHQTRQTVC